MCFVCWLLGGGAHESNNYFINNTLLITMAEPLPKGWELRHSRTSDKSFYFNIYTKSSQWEKPPFVKPEEVII